MAQTCITQTLRGTLILRGGLAIVKWELHNSAFKSWEKAYPVISVVSKLQEIPHRPDNFFFLGGHHDPTSCDIPCRNKFDPTRLAGSNSFTCFLPEQNLFTVPESSMIYHCSNSFFSFFISGSIPISVHVRGQCASGFRRGRIHGHVQRIGRLPGLGGRPHRHQRQILRTGNTVHRVNHTLIHIFLYTGFIYTVSGLGRSETTLLGVPQIYTLGCIPEPWCEMSYFEKNNVLPSRVEQKSECDDNQWGNS